MQRTMRCEERFAEIYRKDPDGVAFSPYRICPIGAHSDHNLGKITGLAINRGIHLAFRPKQNGVVELCSLQFPGRAQWHLREIGEKTGDWADYLRGATLALQRRYPLYTGLCGVIEGDLPVGGLSSSAAVILAFLQALAGVNGLRLSPKELIDTAYDAEKNYVGVNVGKLDQSCEVLSRAGHLLYLDCADDSYELIPAPDNMKPYEIAIFFSGLEHSLVASADYNLSRRKRETCPGKSFRNIGTDCRIPGDCAVNTGTRSSGGSKPAQRRGDAGIWRPSADSPSSRAGAASTTGSQAPRSRCGFTRS